MLVVYAAQLATENIPCASPRGPSHRMVLDCAAFSVTRKIQIRLRRGNRRELVTLLMATERAINKKASGVEARRLL